MWMIAAGLLFHHLKNKDMKVLFNENEEENKNQKECPKKTEACPLSKG